jgi:hypothetical protein
MLDSCQELTVDSISRFAQLEDDELKNLRHCPQHAWRYVQAGRCHRHMSSRSSKLWPIGTGLSPHSFNLSLEILCRFTVALRANTLGLVMPLLHFLLAHSYDHLS